MSLCNYLAQNNQNKIVRLQGPEVYIWILLVDVDRQTCSGRDYLFV